MHDNTYSVTVLTALRKVKSHIKLVVNVSLQCYAKESPCSSK